MSRYFPVGYLAVAIAAVVLALPTALRPPHQPPNTSAELSPDAPPDASQDAIVAQLHRGTSATAGGGPGSGPPGSDAGPEGSLVAAPPAVAPPRSCRAGYGNPPRQAESIYSAPCAPAWQGDNGGSTHRGVAADEIRIGVVQETLTVDGLGLASGEGPEISDTPPPNESAAHRTWRVWQRYFNQSFQLWGRRLRFFVITVNSGSQSTPPSPAEMRAAVQRLDEEYHVFAINSLSSPALEEAARRQLVAQGGLNWSHGFYADHQPYAAAWWMDGTRLMQVSAEYLCGRLMGQPAEFAGDPTYTTKPRKLGLVTEDNSAYGVGPGDELPQLVKQRCGADMVIHRYSGAGNAESSYATGVSQFRLNDVTTVVADAEGFYLAPFLSAATAQGYFPEWFIPGTWANDEPFVPYILQYSRAQWSHAFGISGQTMIQYLEQRDHYRAYKSIDPDRAPVSGGDRFDELLQLINGIQLAGPRLEPQSWRAGLNSMPEPAGPPWRAMGSYAPGDHTYVDDVAEIWWDDTAPNPDRSANGGAGTYRYVDCGLRIGLGTVPSTPPKVFDPAGTCTVAPSQ